MKRVNCPASDETTALAGDFLMALPRDSSPPGRSQAVFGSEPQTNIFNEQFTASETLGNDWDLWSVDPDDPKYASPSVVSSPGTWAFGVTYEGTPTLQQSKNTYWNYLSSDINHVGTIALYKDGFLWRDYTLTSRAKTADNDIFGIVFRYIDENNYYEFNWGSDTGLSSVGRVPERRIRRVKNGVFSDLVLETGAAVVRPTFTSAVWYKFKIEVFYDRINVYISTDGGAFEFWATAQDPDPVVAGTVGASAIACDKLYYDFFEVDLPYHDLPAFDIADTVRTGTFSLGYAVTEERVIPSNPPQAVQASVGISRLYKIEIPASLAGTALHLATALSGSAASANGTLAIYIKKGSAPLTTSFDNAQTNSRTLESFLTIPNIAAGTYFVMVLAQGPIDTEAFNVDFHFSLVDALTLEFASRVTTTLPLNRWAFFKITATETYTGITATVTPNPASSVPYLRLAYQRLGFPTTTSGEYISLDATPDLSNGNVYSISVSSPAEGTAQFFGVFVHPDPDPTAPVPVATQASIEFDILILPDRPVLTLLNPQSGDTAGGYSLVIRGDNIGGPSYPLATTITFDGEPCADSGFTAFDEIFCTIFPGQGTDKEVVVTHFGQTGVSPKIFNFKPPTLSGVAPANGPTAGNTRILVSGRYFGIDHTVLIGDSLCDVVPLPLNPTQEELDAQHTTLKCDTPPGEGTANLVRVNVSGKLTTQQYEFTYDRPVLLSIWPPTGPTLGNTIVTLRGINFGVQGTVTIGDQPCTGSDVLGHNHTMIRCYLPPGQGTGHLVLVEVANQLSTENVLFDYNAPEIDHLDPLVGPTIGGFILTIFGRDFGTSGIIFLDNAANDCELQEWHQTNITCSMPGGEGLNIPVDVSVSGSPSNVKYFDYADPEISRVFPANGPTKGMVPITLRGENFGLTAEVTVGGSTCTNPQQNHTFLVCTLPNGIGRGLDVLLSIESAAGVQTSVATPKTFDYDAPNVTAISPPNGGTIGGYTLVLTGANFGTAGDAVVRVNDELCPVITNPYSHTEIRCSAPAGEGRHRPVVVTVGEQANVDSEVFHYDAPAITDLQPRNVPTGGENTKLTITGVNFGRHTVTPVVTVLFAEGDQPCPISTGSRTATSLPHSRIVCNLPAGRGSDIRVRVEVVAQTNVSYAGLTFGRPSITSVTTSSSPLTLGKTFPGETQILVTIVGASFGASAGVVTIGGELCSTAVAGTSYSHTKIVCALPHFQGKNLELVVETAAPDNFRTNTTFSYAPPQITGISPTTSPTAGTGTLVITGRSLGQSGTVTVGGKPCTLPVWSDRSISCSIPEGQGTDKVVLVRVGDAPIDQESNTNYRLDYDRPSIQDLDPTHGSTAGGYNITVIGQSLGNEAPVSVSVGGKACKVHTQDHGAIVCTMPPGEGSRAVTVTVSLRSSVNAVQFVYDAPTILDVVPGNGTTAGGTPVLVTGQSFGLHGTVYIGPTECTNVTGHTHESLTCEVPPGQGRLLDVTLDVTTAAGVLTDTGVKSGAFSYNKPVIVDVIPANGPTLGGTTLVVSGLSFGDDDLLIGGAGGLVTVGSRECIVPLGVDKYNHTRIECALPVGQGTGIPVRVTVGGQQQQVSNDFLFNYDPPVIIDVLGPLGPSQSGTTSGVGGTKITLKGVNFGSSGVVLVGGEQCTVGVGGLYTSGEIKCDLPEGQGSRANVTVEVGGQISNVKPYKFKEPVIASIKPTKGPTNAFDQGIKLTITGTDFGTSGSITVGGQQCTLPAGNSFYSHTLINCIIPNGQGKGVAVVVTVDGQDEQDTTGNALQFQFSYDSPVVDDIDPPSGVTNGLELVNITGSDFGTLSAVVTASIGDRPCEITARTHTRITCRTPEGVGKNKVVVVSVDGDPSPGRAIFSYAAPTVSRIRGTTPCTPTANGLDLEECSKSSSGDKILTIFGANLGSTTSGGVATKVFIIDTNDLPVECTPVTHNSTHPHLGVTCPFPTSFIGFNRPVYVDVSGQTTKSSPRLISFAGPVIFGNTLRLFNDALPAAGPASLDLDLTGNINGTNGGTIVQFDGKFLKLTTGQQPSVRYFAAGFEAESFDCTDATASPSNCETSCTITCTLSAGVGKDLQFAVHDTEQESTPGVDTLRYPQPEVVPLSLDSLAQNTGGSSPLTGTQTQGEEIYMTAKHIGSDKDVVRVFYGPATDPYKYECEQVALSNYVAATEETDITCRTQPGDGSGLKFIVRALNYDSDRSADEFDYPDAPIITKIEGCTNSGNETTQCPTRGGLTISIHGLRLASSSSVRVGSEDCTNVQAPPGSNQKLLTCLLPPGAGSPSGVVVINNNWFSRTSSLLSYAAPNLTSISGCFGSGLETVACDRDGGNRIVITGKNFGRPTATVLVGGSLCKAVEHTDGAIHEELTCTLGSGTRTNRAVIVLQDNGEISTNNLEISYEQCSAGTFSQSEIDFNCTACPVGKFANSEGEATCTDCDPGRFSDVPGASVCQSCPSGKYSTLDACIICGTGRYNPFEAQVECLECPEGTFNPNQQRTTECEECPPGTEQPDPASTFCTNCTEGYYAPSFRTRECKPCELGRYAVGERASECEPCPAGSFTSDPATVNCTACPKGMANAATGQFGCTICLGGTFTNTTGKEQCDDCPAGKFSLLEFEATGTGPISCTPCPVRTFSASDGADECDPCPSGTHQDEAGQAVCKPCKRGYYSVATSTLGALTCTACDPGKYAGSERSTRCEECPRGKYMPYSNASVCLDCSSGEYQGSTGKVECLPCGEGTATGAQGQTECAPCPDGTFAPGHATECTPCDPGFIAGALSASCTPCDPGQYQSAAGQSICEPCPAGQISSEFNSSGCTVCPGGTFSAADEFECHNCTAGDYSEDESGNCSPCEAGKHSPNDGADDCLDCPEGTVSLGGTATCSECQDGEFQEDPGQTDCDECPPGSFSNSSRASFCYKCPKGFYQELSGQTECQPCPEGYYQDEEGKGSCRLCLSGTYQSLEGQTKCELCPKGKFSGAPTDINPNTQCTNCSEGEYAPNFGTATECQKCPAGFVSDKRGQESCKPCPQGYKQPDTGKLTCIPCPEGEYQSGSGQDACIPCPAGTANNAKGQPVCPDCLAGKKSKLLSRSLVCVDCVEGKFAAGNGSSSCSPCDAGSYAPILGAKACTPCSPGEVQPAGGKSSCTPCPAGEFQSLPGRTDCRPCPSGSFSNDTGFRECTLCPPGQVQSGSGSQGCANCQPGEYQAQSGQSQCDPCPAGTACSGIRSTTFEVCAPGSAAAERSTECTPCTEGTFASDPRTAECQPCQGGTIANDTGRTECYPCPAGSVQPFSRGTECILCDEGKFMSARGELRCTPCDTGYFTDTKGSTKCTPCPKGKVAATGGLSECTNCTLGRYTDAEGQQSCPKCEKGRFAPHTGMERCTLCPPGEHQNVEGKSFCDKCGARKYSAFPGQASCSDCPVGRYGGQEGLEECFLCPPGRSSDVPGAVACEECDQGKFTAANGTIRCTDCATGSFEGGYGSTSCTRCGKGTFQDNQGAIECAPCPEGSFAATNGSVVCEPCGQGTAVNVTGTTTLCPPCAAGTQQSGTGQIECVDCGIGRFSVDGSATCEVCPIGRFQDQKGQPECVPCKIGTFTNQTGQSECRPCPKGQFAAIEGLSQCKPCPSGSKANTTGNSECVPCERGTRQPSQGKSTCIECDVGTFAASEGKDDCDPCRPGTFADRRGLAECTPCIAGKSQPLGGNDTCVPCAVGKFAAGEGLRECADCKPGTYAASTGRQECTLCEPGRYQANFRREECQVCPPGEQAPGTGSKTCTQCPKGKFSNNSETDLCESCAAGTEPVDNDHLYTSSGAAGCDPCPAGTYSLSEGKCVPCIPGHIMDREGGGNGSCDPCPAGTYADAGNTMCVTCEAGTFAEKETDLGCEPCTGNKVSLRGAGFCEECRDNSVAVTTTHDRCVCNTGYFYDDSWKNPPTQECYKCDKGADCTEPDTQFSTMGAREGWWRAYDEDIPGWTNNFYRCLIRGHCSGGEVDANATAAELERSQCLGNRDGPICAVCKEGYHSPTTTGDCQECPKNKTQSWAFSVIVSLVIVMCIIFMYWVVLRTDRNLVEEAKQRAKMKKENEWAWFEDEEDRVNKTIYDKDTVALGGAPKAKPNFMYKMKIVLGFFQITVNLAFALDIPWPSHYQNFISAFGIVNFDIIQWSSFACVTTANYYLKYWAVTVTPIVVLVLVFIFFLLPRYVADMHSEDDYDLRKAARQRSNRKFWKLFLFTLFLIYPGVSSTVLRLYVCREVEGERYLLADFSIKCSGSKYEAYELINVGFVLLYPVGIPLFFFLMLWKYRSRLTLPDIRVQLGFLYDAYATSLWYFELVDMLNKLILTSLLAFFGKGAVQLRLGMAFAAAYLIILLLVKPYVRKGDDRLHLFAQLEIMLILMAGLYFYDRNDAVLDDRTDIAMSTVLIGITVGLFFFFVYQVIYVLRKIWRRSQRKRMLKEREEEAGTDVEMTQDLRTLRLPKDALMIRNPLFEAEDTRQDTYDPDYDDFEGSEGFGSDDGFSSELSPDTDEGPSASANGPPARSTTHDNLVPQIEDVGGSDGGMDGAYSDQEDDDDDVFTAEFAPRSIRRG